MTKREEYGRIPDFVMSNPHLSAIKKVTFMALIWRVLPLLFLANTVYGKIEFDALAYSYCIKDGFSVEIGRIKGEKYQISFAHVFRLGKKDKYQRRWLVGGGLWGFGMRKLLEKDGSREVGFLIWPFSTGEQRAYIRPRAEFSGLAQFYYRVNPRSEFVSFEAGIIATIYTTDRIARIYLGVAAKNIWQTLM